MKFVFLIILAYGPQDRSPVILRYPDIQSACAEMAKHEREEMAFPELYKFDGNTLTPGGCGYVYRFEESK